MHRPPARLFALVVALAAAATAGSADARRPAPPTVELGSSAILAPDGRSISTSVVASCDEGSTVLEASVTIAQAGASGSGTFAITCIGPFPRVLPVTVRATTGRFALGAAQAVASLVVSRGKTQQAQDTGALSLDPGISVDLPASGTLVRGGAAVELEVTVACAPGPRGLESYVAVSQGNVVGRGTYVPVCDGSAHAFTVTAVAAQGAFHAGDARSLSFADVDWNGVFFTGVGDEPLRIVA